MRDMDRTKFGNKKVSFRGSTFDSIGERDRWIALLDDQENGKIKNLQRQVSFDLTSHGQLICRYIADFTYNDKTGYVVEDYKGIETDVFKIKKKLMKACYDIDILITKRKSWNARNVFGDKSWKTSLSQKCTQKVNTRRGSR